MPQLPVAMAFYAVARDYDQDRAKEDLTDNNLRIARAADPPQGDWAYVAMTEQHAPANVIKRSRTSSASGESPRHRDRSRTRRAPADLRPQLEDWMLDITLGDEPSVDAYVWSVSIASEFSAAPKTHCARPANGPSTCSNSTAKRRTLPRALLI